MMREVSDEAKKSIRETIGAVLNDPFPVEMKVKYLSEHFIALLEHVDEKEYCQSIYGRKL